MGPWTAFPSDEHHPDCLGMTDAARSGPGTGRGTPSTDPGGRLPSSPPQLWSGGAPSTSHEPPEKEHCPLSPADPLDRVAFQLLLPLPDRRPGELRPEEIQ